MVISIAYPAVFFLGAFLATLALTPGAIERLRRQGFVVPDVYKRDARKIVTHVGLLGLGVAIAALLLLLMLHPPPSLFSESQLNVSDPFVAAQLALFTICGYGIVGALDDRRSLSHIVKAVVPFTLGLSAAVVVAARPDSITVFRTIPFLAVLGPILPFAVVPLYILVVTNLVNMHSGFNGLQSGLSLILLATILLRLMLEGRFDQGLALVPVFGSLAAFFPFNRYPARAIEGNVGSFLVGSAIGVGLATSGLFIAGIVMMAPHVLDFALFAFTKVTARPFLKYGTVRADGSIQAPYPFKLKFLLPYGFPLTEVQTVRLLYLVTFLACGLSFLIPY
jgi:UDP-N-acetylglucosamine--dolichyl-phosphate N-acetylglucosaminephosphotransferase